MRRKPCRRLARRTVLTPPTRFKLSAEFAVTAACSEVQENRVEHLRFHSFLAEVTLKSDLWAKLDMVDLDSRVVLIKPSLDSAPQTFPEASVTSFTHHSTAFVNWACLECYIPIKD
ncbi:hypothetical protein AVEN_182745-1 [Araneus ventricosus]|uniref:Uncharacterized protein n=1 Tax=Araneus ventricosus TaxID=182803 RepID=A0A4Y2N3Y9_ARAVE|nr:hypothetical protein AVEN_182745-1 [Araneus ventricosus]